ncbi:MAG: DNRLRE domain-containing protein [Candidatus Woesearchaeota archaeon]
MSKKIILLFLIMSFYLCFFARAETYEKRQLFFTGGNSFFDVDLKISTTGKLLKDNNNNVLQDGDYVCDFSKENLKEDNFFDDENGEWYFNGGQMSSPSIVWDEEVVKKARDIIIKLIPTNPYYTYTNTSYGYYRNQYGKFLDTPCSFCGWDTELQNIISGVELSNLSEGYTNMRCGAVVCADEEKGIACIAVGAGYVFAPNGSNSYELFVFGKQVSGEALRALAEEINFETVSSSPNYNLAMNDLKLNLLDKVVLSFKLKNDGEIPLRIKNIRVLFNGKELSFVDVLNIVNTEIGVGSNKDVVLELEKFFDDPCDLLNKDVKVVVEYDAPRFKCDHQISDSVEDKISITEDYKTNYELRVVYPQDDFYLYSKSPGNNFNNRIDLHVGNDDGILRSYIYQDISKLDSNNLLKALFVFNVMELKGDNIEVSIYKLPNNFNPSIIKWSVQPRIGEKIETKKIEKTGLFDIDVTDYVKKKKGFGFALRAVDESLNADVIINSLESEQKPKIKLYYKSEKTLKEQCKQ